MTLYEPCKCCGGFVHPTAKGNEISDLSGEILRIAKTIHAGENVVFDNALLRAQAGQLLKAVFAGYGKDFNKVDFGTPDCNMLDNLTNNVYQFSTAKNYQELKDMTTAIRDGDKVRPWAEYKQQVESINGKYNSEWLRTEYNTAISSAQMASRWTQFEAEKKDFPLLKYQTVGDANVRQSHAVLNLVKKPVDDSFWLVHYPPNGWNCRCEAVQVTGAEKETADKDITLPVVDKMFRTNLAKQGLVFPSGHPYYVGIPDTEWKGMQQKTRAEVNKYYDGMVKSWMDKNIDEGETVHELKNIKSGKISITRAAIREIMNHANGSNKLVATKLPELLPELKLFKENVPLKKGSNAKEKRGVTHYNYYEFDISGKKYLLNMEVFKNGMEKPYSVRSKKDKS